MRRKIIVLGIAMLLIISGMAFVNMDRIVTAYPGDEGDGENLLNTSYAYDITEQLSKIITDVYEDGELAKGRAFGSKGEHFAAENIIAYEMDKIGLWNPNLNPPYLEQIEPIESMYDDFDKLDNLTDKLEVLEQEIKINGTDVIDGVIRPRWNLAGAGYLDRPLPNWLIETYNVYPRSWLTNNYSHTDLQIYRTLLMSWWDDFVKSLNPFIEQELLENESIVGFKDFFNWIMSYFEDYYEFTFETLNESAAKENFTWIDESFYNRAGFVYIEEDPAFNPDYNLPDWGPIMNNIMGGSSYEWMRKAGFMIRSMIWRFIPCCKGLIRFDFNDDTFNHELNDYWALPTIYVNKSIGEPIYEDAKTLSPSTSTIDFYVN